MTRLWDFFEEQAGGLFLLMSVMLVFGQIVARSVFGFGISGLYEIATYCALCSVFLTSSIAIKHNIHIRIDILANIVPTKWAFGLEILVLLLMAVVCATLCGSGIMLVKESWILGERTIGTISVPVWVLQLILPTAGLFMFLRCLQRMWSVVRRGASRFQVVPSELEVL